MRLAALVSNEVEDVRRSDVDRILVDDREERLQIMGDGPQRVRSAPASNERQVGIDERLTQREAGLPTRGRSSDQTRELVHPHMLQPSLEGPEDAPRIIRVLGDMGHLVVDSIVPRALARSCTQSN
jgi:hypothetical protein